MRITGKKKSTENALKIYVTIKIKISVISMQMVKQDIKQCTQKYALSFQLPRMNTETPLLTLALFFALLQLITYYPLAVYMRERERERERCTCEF